MAASQTTGFSIPVSAPTRSVACVRRNHRRHITPQAGRALEILGHAIEYLTDEFVHECNSFSGCNSQLEAVQLLMAVNRRIYYECPEVPTLGERCLSFLRLHAA